MSGAGLLQGSRSSPALALLGRFMLASVLWGGGSAFAAEARIAVSANFRDTAEAIAARLEAESPHRYQVIAGLLASWRVKYSTARLMTYLWQPTAGGRSCWWIADWRRLLINRFMPWESSACGGRVAPAPQP